MTQHGRRGNDIDLIVRRLVTTGRRVGATTPFFAAHADNGKLFREVVALVRRKASGPTYDVAAVASLLGLRYPKRVLRQYAVPPAPLPGFLTFFDPGWTLLRIRRVGWGRGVIFPQDWYAREPFAKASARPRYRQLRFAPMPRSLGKTFAAQEECLLAGEAVPRARVVLAAMVIHFLATGERLYHPQKVRCADTTAAGGRVDVAFYDPGGIDVDYHSDSFQFSYVGLAAEWKPRRPGR